MSTFLWLLVVTVIVYVVIRSRKPKSPPEPVVSVTALPTKSAHSDDLRRHVRDEIKRAIAPHIHAVKLLQSLARIDGSTSESERRLIFMFLLRRGASLSEDRHWPEFVGYDSGEFMRSVELDEFAKYLEGLEPEDRTYKIDVYSTAQAIVSSGGTPKKKEQAALEMLAKMAL